MTIFGRLLIVFCSLLLGFSHGYAQNKVLGIIIEMTNGEKMEYRLVDNPLMLFDGKTITLTADDIKVEFTPKELQKVMMGDVENVVNAINEVVTNQGTAEVNSGFVRLSGFQSGETVRVYNIAGILADTFKIYEDGTLVISISSLPSGTSIIKTNKQSIKISKR